jgi:alanyl-tRNA synthetase
MKSQELRQKFIDYFLDRDHAAISSYPLVPENDPSVLFTTAGMHPLVPYLLGEKHPLGKRIVDVQKCLRTDDIEEIGDNSHLTFFEMLGYWSLGDYFKKESIKFTFNFYIEVLGFNKDDISVSVFAGDKDADFDQESFDVWKNEIGIPENRIYKYDKKENWWGPVGDTGPCGPCSEMFIDTGIDACGPNCDPSCNCDKFVEISNNVFMEFFKKADGSFEKLSQKNVDVGLGLERLIMFAQGKNSVFETDLFENIISKIKSLSTNENEVSIKIIADHLRAATFILAEKLEPSNVERGYILRRLIRRSIRHGKILGISGAFTSLVAKEVIETMKDIYPEVKTNEAFVLEQLDKEEEKFEKTLERGMLKLEEILKSSNDNIVTGKEAFDLFQTYGFPIEMTEELATEKGFKVDRKEFDQEYKAHQDLSRKGAEQKFKGGLADNEEETIKLHTAAHLLHEALRQVLGAHVKQAGANINAERLRFDFTHPQKMTPEEIKEVECLVNEKIKIDIPISCKEMPLSEAKKSGAMGIFDSKYEEKVKVYTIGDYSKEICGGPHVESTGELGVFKIKKEESSSAGVRRIKAILE